MKRKDIILLVVPFFILVLIWIGLSIYHNLVTSTIPEVLNIQITPINPAFDEKTILNLKNREKVTPVFEAQQSSPSAE